MGVEWLEALKEATPQGEIKTITTCNKFVQDKGKRKISESIEMEQSYKFKEDPHAEKVDLVYAKRQQRIKIIAQRKREKKRLEETRKLQEVEQKLKEEKELHRREKEVQHE